MIAWLQSSIALSLSGVSLNSALKRHEVEAAGADKLVTACGQCRITLTLGAKHFKWDKKVDSLLELVADNLAD